MVREYEDHELFLGPDAGQQDVQFKRTPFRNSLIMENVMEYGELGTTRGKLL
jgi:hypothetical protein